jgi:hypothetical protein
MVCLANRVAGVTDQATGQEQQGQRSEQYVSKHIPAIVLHFRVSPDSTVGSQVLVSGSSSRHCDKKNHVRILRTLRTIQNISCLPDFFAPCCPLAQSRKLRTIHLSLRRLQVREFGNRSRPRAWRSQSK